MAVAFAALVPRAARADAPTVCVPGTPLCAGADGRGGVRIDANGGAQVGPNGASVNGQANGNGNANAGAWANGQGAARGDGSGSRGGGSHRRRYEGRFGVGVDLCPVVRAGLSSGFKVGACAGVSFRWEALTFEMETQLVYGGTTKAVDWTFPMSFLVPLGNERSLFDGPYLRFGGSPIGATFAAKSNGGSFVRFGLFAGAGYEMPLGSRVSWRVIDARLSLDMGTKRAMDRERNWLDPGVQLSTGLIL